MQKTYKIPYKLDDGDSYYLISMNKIMNGHINLRVKAKHLFFGWLDKNTDIKNVKFDLPIKVNYTLHPDVNVLGSKPDTNNILMAIDKYLMDYLVKKGCLVDDSSEYIKKTTFQTGTDGGYVKVDIYN